MFLLKLILGSVSYKVKGKNTQVLINYLRERIPIMDISVGEDEIFRFTCFYKHASFVEEVIKERHFDIISKKERGITCFAVKHKNRAAIAVAGALLYVLINISSLFVWEIRVEGNEKVTSEEIKNTLKSIGFSEGCYKRSIDMDSLVNNFLINEGRISWIAVNLDGTVAHVEVKEAKLGQMAIQKENVNLVASHDGIIIRVDALEGQAQVMSGDAVTKGQLLVSAYVPKKTGGELLRGASGFVWAFTQREYVVRIPLTYTQKQYTGRQKNNITLSALGVDIPLYFRSSPVFSLYDFETKKERVSLSGNKVLPFEIKSEKFKEYKIYTKRRTEKEAKELARSIVNAALSEKSPNFKTTQKQEDFKIEEDVLILNCKINGVENIAKELEFALS